MQSFAPDLIIEPPRPAFLTDAAVDILRYAADALDEGIGAALVTLVEIRGGAARSLGAQMAVREDGLYCGFVSGGCTEAAIAAEAVEAIAKGLDRFVLLGEGARFFDIVLPCGGGIKLTVHVLKSSASLYFAISELASRRHVALRYDPATQVLDEATSTQPTGWLDGAFVCHYRPVPRLLLHGGSIEVERTAIVARAAGFDVIVHDDRRSGSLARQPIDQDAAVVLLYHDIDRELPVLEAALREKPFYIGALGSARTHRRRSEMLRKIGFNDDDIKRIKAPIGIFGKARDSTSLALSVLADVAAARTLELNEGSHPRSAAQSENGPLHDNYK